MGLKYVGGYKTHVVAPYSVFLTDPDKNGDRRPVLKGDPDASMLLVAEGCAISVEDVKKYGLFEEAKAESMEDLAALDTHPDNPQDTDPATAATKPEETSSDTAKDRPLSGVQPAPPPPPPPKKDEPDEHDLGGD